jgi:hypothetical protein
MKGKRGVILGVHHVDSGYHVVGMKRPEVPDISLAKDNWRSIECRLSITSVTVKPSGTL